MKKEDAYMLSLKGREVKLTIIYKKIKNTYIRPKSESEIIISTNMRKKEKILDLIHKNEDKIIKMLERKKNKYEVYFNKVGYNVVENKNINKLLVQDRVIFVKNKTKFLKEYKKDVYNRFNQIYLDTKMKMNISKIPELKLRKMKTRWGVCNKKSNTITLNEYLNMFDDRVINYVIIHELCHLKEMNHSKKFWCLVSEYEPNYKEIRREMNNHE